MLDARARRFLAPVLDLGGRWLHGVGVRADHVTIVGVTVGAAACVAAALGAWVPALGLWLSNRLIDGLDGPVARREPATPWGGFVDIVADFAVYGGFVVGVAVALPEARLACSALLGTYYLNGAALLAFDAAAERHRVTRGADGRSLRFLGGLAEGTETIAVHSLFCLFPGLAAPIAWTFAAIVAVTAVWRIRVGLVALRAGHR